MKKILILTFIICIFLNNISYCEDYDTQPLTLQNFNFEFDYIEQNKLTLQNFNFEFDYIKATFIFNLSEIKSDYFRYKKLTELYSQLSDYYFGSYEYWYNLALLENDVYYRQPNLEYLKFKRLAAKYK